MTYEVTDALISARIVGAILFIVISTVSNPSEGLEIATFVVQSAAVSPLMLATAGFLGVVYALLHFSFFL